MICRKMEDQSPGAVIASSPEGWLGQIAAYSRNRLISRSSKARYALSVSFRSVHCQTAHWYTKGLENARLGRNVDDSVIV